MLVFVNHVVSVSNDFSSNSKGDALFHHIAIDYSHADWDGPHDYLRDVPWEDIFKLGASAAASEFCEWVRVGTDAYIPHLKISGHASLISIVLAVCVATIAHRNHFFCLYQH